MISLFRDQAPDLLEWIWTKVGWLTGERFPVNEAFSEKDNEYIQKCFLDSSWLLRLEDMIDGIDQRKFPHMDGAIRASAYNSDAISLSRKQDDVC